MQRLRLIPGPFLVAGCWPQRFLSANEGKGDAQTFCTIRRPRVCGLPAGSILNLKAIEKAPRERGLGIASAVCPELNGFRLASLQEPWALPWIAQAVQQGSVPLAQQGRLP